MDIIRLKRWFLSERRDLPWRESPSPYAVWISEVMLQQTQVSVVIPFFERWMERFPTISDLAAASLDEVIKMWEGLGYYSRARHLHEGAKTICQKYHGELPNNHEDLSKIKGLGPYTVGAILSFAFHQKTSAVDANVARVLARYYSIQEDISQGKTINQIRTLAEGLLPDDEPWVINEGLIELGALICAKKPKCNFCPIKSSCKAYLNGEADRLPIKKRKVKTEHLARLVFVLKHKDLMLVQRGQKGKIMSDLHEFPYIELDLQEDRQAQIEKTFKEWTFKAVSKFEFPLVMHSFTRYQVKLFPYLFECDEANPILNYQWLSANELNKLAFSSGHKKIWNLIKQNHFS